MLPEWTELGVLPASADLSPWPCGLEVARQRLVLDFPAVDWRAALFNRFEALRALTAQHLPRARWWLWGVLVSTSPDPWWDSENVRGAILVPLDDVSLSGGAAASFLQRLPAAAVNMGCDIDILFEVPGDQRAYDELEEHVHECRRRASRNTAVPHGELGPAGFIEVVP